MGVIETRIFKSGNSAAVRLPKELGFEPGMTVRIERVGQTVKIKPALDPAEEKQKLLDLMMALEALGSVDEIGERLPVDIPDRAVRER